MWDDGGIGIRDGLRNHWSNPSEFESLSSHHCRKKSFQVEEMCIYNRRTGSRMNSPVTHMWRGGEALGNISVTSTRLRKL